MVLDMGTLLQRKLIAGVLGAALATQAACGSPRPGASKFYIPPGTLIAFGLFLAVVGAAVIAADQIDAPRPAMPVR